MAIDFYKMLDDFNDALFPGLSCACCGEELIDNSCGLCDICKQGLNLHNNNCCQKCGEPLDHPRDICPACANANYEFKRAISCCEYNELSGKLIKDLKYNGKKYIAKIIANFLAEKYKECGFCADYITFVPSGKSTLKERGYNQGKLICDEFSLLTNVPVLETLERVKETERQATLSGEERRKNIIGAFAPVKEAKVYEKNVLLVDDVFSTGTTLSESVKALKKLKPKNVLCLTFAKVHFLKELTKKNV